MRKQKVKADWASLALADSGSVVICTKASADAGCIWFRSQDQFTEALNSKTLSVKRWAITVPKGLCIEKTLVLPACDFAEAAKMVEFELSSLVPLPPDKIVYGCTLKSQEKNSATLAVTILRTKALEEFLLPYRDMGVEPNLIVVDSLAIWTWFESQDSSTSGQTVNVFMDPRRGILLSSLQGRLQAVEDLLWPAGAEKTGYADIAAHLVRQSTLLSTVNAAPLCRLVLGGHERVTRPVKEGLETISAFQRTDDASVSIVPNPTEACHPFNGEKDTSSQLVYECCVATGAYDLATRSLQPHANLVPTDFLRKQEKKSRTTNFALTAGLAVILIVLTYVAFVTANGRTKRTSNLIESMIAPVEAIAGDVENKRLLVSAIERQFAKRGRLPQIIDELSRYTGGASVTIHDFRFERKQNECLVDIKGQARDNAAVWDLPDLMQEAEFLKHIEILDIGTKSDRSGKNSTAEFKLHCLIKD